jgi:hypothetical protein
MLRKSSVTVDETTPSKRIPVIPIVGAIAGLVVVTAIVFFVICALKRKRVVSPQEQLVKSTPISA